MRDESKKIERRIATDLDQHLTTRVNLYHEPGAGGTTVSKRIAWSLFQSYPVCILKHYSSDSTYRKIAKIVNETNKSVLVIIERSLFSESEIDDFYEKLKAESISAVLFQVIRKFELSKEDKNTEKSRIFYLKENLSPFEMNTFKVTYLNDLPRKKDKIEKYAESLSQKTAFLFGLNAYDDEYIGIENYVQARFENLTETQKRLFVFLSFVEYYAQTGLLIECVDSLLGRESQNNNINLNHFFNNNPYHSLDMIEILPRELKIIHFAIAKKIFEFFYGENWKNQLVNISIEFIDKCSDNSQAISNKVMKLIKKIFIERDSKEYIDFSNLILDIPTKEGQLHVFEQLTEKFPREAHFHAHYGRIQMSLENFEPALESISLAIDLQENEDHVLYHIKGMIYGKKMQKLDAIEENKDEIISFARESSLAFEKSRDIKPNIEHAYISAVQLYIDLIDKISRLSHKTPIEYISTSNVNEFVVEAMDRAEVLLDELLTVNANDDPSERYLRVRSRLDALYGEFSKSLQDLDNALNRTNVNINKNLIRRQLVNTLLEQRKRNWQQLKPRELSRIERLLDENIKNDLTDTPSIKLWLRSIREIKDYQISLDSLLEKIFYWKSNTLSLEAIYYSYVYFCVKYLEGVLSSLHDATENLGKLQQKTRFKRDRRVVYEWYGKDTGIHRLVHYSNIRDRDTPKNEIYNMDQLLFKIEGRIATILKPERGYIKINDLDVHFNPAKHNIEKNRDEKKRVEFYLGFTYDGPIATEVVVLS